MTMVYKVPSDFRRQWFRTCWIPELLSNYVLMKDIRGVEMVDLLQFLMLPLSIDHIRKLKSGSLSSTIDGV